MELPKWMTDVAPVKQGVNRTEALKTTSNRGCGCEDKIKKLEDEVNSIDEKYLEEDISKQKQEKQ